MIPGARGCTPQSCSFRDYFAELRGLITSSGSRPNAPLPVGVTTRLCRMPSCRMLAASPSIALRSIFRGGFTACGSNTDSDTDCNFDSLCLNECAKPRPRGPSSLLSSFFWTDGCACTRCLPASAGVASVRRLRTRVPSGRRWDALRARGAAPHSDQQNKVSRRLPMNSAQRIVTRMGRDEDSGRKPRAGSAKPMRPHDRD
jgi:hypothetical protein